MRTPLVAANWKMNLNLASMRALAGDILRGLAALETAHVDVALCPPFPHLFPLAKALADSTVSLGAQNVYFEPSGAFTGEVSAAMLAETGAKYVIIGHSERRHTIGHLEDDRMINRKVRAARAAGMTPILCVGETLAERQGGQTQDVLTFQITAGLVEAEVGGPGDLVIAYEPVWAIGTGHNATAAQAQEAHAHIRGIVRKQFGKAADDIRILYGGSVKPENAGEIFSQPDVDGGLIGGASLKAESFLGIVKAARPG